MALFRDATEPSQGIKVVLVTVSLLAALFTSGVIFGYAGIFKVLVVDEKMFIDKCEPMETVPCEGQTQSLTNAYTLGAATISASSILVGVVLDAVGPRVTIVTGSLAFSLGLAALSLSKTVSSSLVFLGFFLLSMGGPAIFNSMINFAELFPFFSSAIIAGQNGMFDASALVLFLMGKVEETLRIPLSTIMLSYLVVPISLVIVSLLLVPDKPYGSSGGRGGGKGGELWRVYGLRRRLLAEDSNFRTSAPASALELESELGLESAAGGGEDLEEPSDVYNARLTNQISSPIFMSQCFITGYYILRSNFYIASIYNQLNYISVNQSPPGSSSLDIVNQTQTYIEIFNWLLPAGGALMVPLAGYVMVHLGMASSFFIIGFMMASSTAIQVFYHLPISFQVVSFVLYALVRPFIFGATAAFIGRVFGFSNFGRLFGINRLSGAIATILQGPLMSLAEHTCGGNYAYVNIGFLVVEILIALIYPYYLWKSVFYGFLFRPPAEVEELS